MRLNIAHGKGTKPLEFSPKHGTRHDDPLSSRFDEELHHGQDVWRLLNLINE